MLVIASRFDEALMPSSDSAFWISRWPAPRKLRPMSVVPALTTPGVVVARFQTLRPFSGSSRMARSPMVSRTVALSVLSTVKPAATSTTSVTAPAASTAFTRTTWLVAISTSVALKPWKPVRRDRDLVAPGADELDVEVALAVRCGLERVLGADVDGDDLCAGHHAAGAVGDGSDQCRLRGELGANTPGAEKRARNASQTRGRSFMT